MGGKSAKMSLRLTESERVHVDSQCSKYGIKSSEYVRRLIEQDMGRINVNDMTPRDIYLQRKELVYEINRIGNNINQITKNVNSNFYTDYEKKKLFAMMDKINKLLEEKL